jgi:PAS domain S-box-containing protein
MHPEDAERIGAAFQAAMAHEGPQGAPSIEYRAIAKDGRVVWLEAHPKALHDPMTGLVIAYQDAIRDITGRKDVEFKLAEMEARYALLAEHSHDLLMVSDLDGRLTYISPSLRATTGADPEPLLGRRYTDLIHRDDVERLEVLRARTLGAGQRGPAERVEYRARHIDGRWMWFETTPLPMIDANGKATGILDVARDVTERKMLGEQLERKCEEAEAAAVAKTEFLANMSHEIRTPLTGVIGFSDLLSDLDDLPPTAKLYADRISTAGRSLLTVVNDILDFSKLEAGQLVLDPHGFAPMDFVAETLDLVAGQVDAKGLTLTVRQDGFVPGHVEADSARLRQVLLNLLTNAVKFTAQGGVDVTVAYDETGVGRLRIAVTDTGAGVPEALKERLFQRFSQVDGSISRQHGGTGLGLAICKSLIGLMDGEIGVDSAAGQGSTFWFTLAAPQTEALPADSGGAHAAEGLELGAARILVVDDVMANRELVRAILSPFVNTITEAENGSDAVSQAIQSRFDVILMDLQMPGMDGLAATRAIRATAEQNRATPIIALSANVLPEQIGECLAAGMDDHVAKPIKVAELLQKVFHWAASERLDVAAA